ncbi:sideroflexin-5 isoform X1 [Hydra vulgaris]|nr:sideroflexin-5 [Hydra vulgaris]
MQTYPPFSIESQRFNQDTYFGRLQRCFDIVDPRTLFVSEKTLQDSIKMIEDFKKGERNQLTDAQLWRARKIKEAIIHPDTGEKIFAPFRMSGYVPFGTLPVIGMLIPGASFGQVIFWQWLNQSHNACVNYANRNATKATAISSFIKSYFAAVASAISIALSFSYVIKKSRLSPEMKLFASRFVAYPATSLANICNVCIMRSGELKDGIDVEDENGNVIGVSKIAAKQAVFETALSRVFLPAPILIFPPLIMSALEKTRFLTKHRRLIFPVNVFVCTMSFGLALPFAIALFPQQSKMSKEKLEPEIADKTKSLFVKFNKGL